MGYHKFVEEQKWLAWKAAEERQLRALGVEENVIQRLREYDREQFNAERRYRQKQVALSAYIDWSPSKDVELPITDTESLLNSLENSELWKILSKESKQTLEIVLLKMMGYDAFEISEKIGISQKAVNLRLVRLRKKLKKIFFA